MLLKMMIVIYKRFFIIFISFLLIGCSVDHQDFIDMKNNSIEKKFYMINIDLKDMVKFIIVSKKVGRVLLMIKWQYNPILGYYGNIAK
jgi:hypothetical protein